MSVRAKFKVTKITRNSYQPEAATIHMDPASADANGDWSKWTPSGSIEMYITNPVAIEALSLGAEFYVDFTKAGE